MHKRLSCLRALLLLLALCALGTIRLTATAHAAAPNSITNQVVLTGGHAAPLRSNTYGQMMCHIVVPQLEPLPVALRVNTSQVS
jgi:hypothetical protein